MSRAAFVAACLVLQASTSWATPPGVSVGSVGSAVAVTIATVVPDGKRVGFCRLLESAVQNGIQLRILGANHPWGGPGTKLLILHDFLSETEGLRDDTVVVFVDAFDVMFVHPLHVLVDKFKRSGAPIVMGAECSCFPAGLFDNTTCRAHPPSTVSPYVYLNSGTIVGYAGALLRVLRHIVEANGVDGVFALDDQYEFMKLYTSGDWGVGVDTGGDLFQTFSTPNYPSTEAQLSASDSRIRVTFARHPEGSPEWLRCNPLVDVVNGTQALFAETGTVALRNGRTGAEPSVLHFNGLGPSSKNATRLATASAWYNVEPRSVGGRHRHSRRPLSTWELAETEVFRGTTFGDLCFPVAPKYPWELGDPMPTTPLELFSPQVGIVRPQLLP